MSADQAWRVVDDRDREHEVSVFRCEFGFAWGAGNMFDPHKGRDQREAVLRWAVAEGIDIAEILAPGEPSRAELIAQRDAAWREGAEAMRGACVDAALTALSRGDCDVVTPVRECPIPTRPEAP